jgi:hypothetical protein
MAPTGRGGVGKIGVRLTRRLAPNCRWQARMPGPARKLRRPVGRARWHVDPTRAQLAHVLFDAERPAQPANADAKHGTRQLGR